MKIIVINGSPKGERSDTLKLTKAFLQGMKQDAEIVDTMNPKINPCLGCYSCWTKTPGKCVQKDGMEVILEKIANADLVIWSSPLYCYSYPSNCKAVLDRLLPLSTQTQTPDANGETHHEQRTKRNTKHMLISGCGFPDREGNYDALIFQFKRMFGKDSAMILCPEVPMFSAKIADVVTVPYLALVRKAGEEYAACNKISDETQAKLDALMIPADEYRKHTNA